MKFLVVLILAAVAGALVCGEESSSDTAAQEPADNSANAEAPAETTSEPAKVPAEAAQTTLAAEKSAENQEATTQEAESSTTRISIIGTAAAFIKNKIEDAEGKIKDRVEATKEVGKNVRKSVRAFFS